MGCVMGGKHAYPLLQRKKTSVFLGYSLHNNLWKDNPEQKAGSALLERYAEMQEIQEKRLSPDRWEGRGWAKQKKQQSVTYYTSEVNM